MTHTNTLSFKRKLIRELTKNVTKELLRDLPRVPSDWDGIELRLWIAMRFEQACFGDVHPRRKRAFLNAVNVFNL